jgi:hypothetical protein
MAQGLGAPCAVAICHRRARWLVTFRSGGTYLYCGFHTHDFRGKVRWKTIHVLRLEKIDA